MKVAILAGGIGSRLAEETSVKPKAMVEIGERPILWHIMKYYSHFGFNDFVIALGYKGDSIKRWMKEYSDVNSNVIVKTDTDEVLSPKINEQNQPDWTVRLVDTGQTTQTGGRIKRLAPWLGNQTFMLTWCDGLADVDLQALLRFHQSHGRLATLTAVRPPSRFGHLVLKGDNVTQFNEKPRLDWVNGAYFVLEPQVFEYIEGDSTRWEKEPLKKLATDNQLMAFRHDGFWQCIDTLVEKRMLDKVWYSGNAAWKTWKT